jgi:RimJ/RimL family protein N-acetyltransferase
MFIYDRALAIRNAAPEDAALLCAWWNDGTVMAHAGFPRGLGIDEKTVVRQLGTDADETGRRLIIEAEGVPIGEMSYRNLGRDTAVIGIKICVADMRGKGYGSRCLTMLIARLFAMGYRKIVLDTNLNNLRAQHVYEKLGFTKLRVNKDAWKDQLGQWQSSVDYELIPPRFLPSV